MTEEGQYVRDSVVFGDVILVNDVGGSVTIGAPRPPYRIMRWPDGSPELTVAQARVRPTRLLQPRYAVVAFTGRDAERAELRAWLDEPAEPVAVRLVHAAGGQGKTRLADDVAVTCRDAGWAVWQARPQVNAVAAMPAVDRLDLPPAGILVVVDYADRWRATDLIDLMGVLQRLARLRGSPVRVLLLGRTAKGWWPATVGLLHDRYDLDTTTNTALPPLATSAADRAVLFHDAAVSFAERLGVTDLDAAALSPPPDLDQGAYAQVLAVHMAALTAVDAHRRGTRAPTDVVAVSDYLLCREAAAWAELHENRREFTRPAVMHRLTYLATLCGTLARPWARVALDQADLAENTGTADQLIDHHLACYPATDPGKVFEPLHPDRLGEDLVALSTTGHGYPMLNWQPDDWVTAAATSDDERVVSAAEALVGAPTPGTAAPWSSNVLAVLAETAHRWSHVTDAVVNPLLLAHPHLLLAAGGPTATRMVDVPGLDRAVIDAVEALLPDERNVNIDVAAAAIAERATELRLATARDPAERARLHGRLALRFAHAGRHADALQNLQQAVALAREAGAERDLATWTTALSLQLSAAGRRTEALAMARDAVDLRRAVVGRPGGRSEESDLAAAVTNLGKALAEVGRRREALACSQEAAAIYRRLADADPDPHRADLALALHNVAASYSEAHLRVEALDAAQESADIYRALADGDPQQYLPDLADALTNLQAYRSELDDPEGAIEAGEEAVRICRQLVDINAAAFAGDLAGSLYDLSVTRSRAGLPHDALEPGREATDRYRELAQAHPDAHLRDVALARNNLGKLLSEVGRFADAEATATDAVDDFRRLVAIESEAYRPELAMALYNLAANQLANGHGAAAVASAGEAVAVYRHLYERDADEHHAGLADALHNLGVILGETGRWVDGLPHIREAVGHYRQLRADDPDGAGADWAVALSSLGQALHEVGRDDDGLPYAQQAVAVARTLDDGLPVLAGTLNNLAVCLAALGRQTPARAAARESVARYGDLADELPEVYGPLLEAAEQTLRDIG